MCRILILALFLSVFVKAADPAKSSDGKKSSSQKRTEKSATSWGHYIIVPTEQQLRPLYNALRIDTPKLSATVLKPGEHLKISCMMRNITESGAPLVVYPSQESKDVTKNYPVGMYSRRVRLIGPAGMDLSRHKPLEEPGSFSSYGPADTMHGVIVWPTQHGKLWSNTYELAEGRDAHKPSDGMWVGRLESGDKTIWQPKEPVEIPPLASFEVDYEDIETDEMKQGTYEVSVFYSEYSGKIISVQHTYFTLTNSRKVTDALKASELTKITDGK